MMGVGRPISFVEIPTLGEAALVILASALALAGASALRRLSAERS